MVNMLFSEYNFNESWAMDIVARDINSNDKVLIIPFSFGEEIGSDIDWQNAYNKDNGKYYKSVVVPWSYFGKTDGANLVKNVRLKSGGAEEKEKIFDAFTKK